MARGQFIECHHVGQVNTIKCKGKAMIDFKQGILNWLYFKMIILASVWKLYWKRASEARNPNGKLFTVTGHARQDHGLVNEMLVSNP